MSARQALEAWLAGDPQLVKWPDARLREPAAALPALPANLLDTVRRRLLKCMDDWGGCGLAGPQVGLPWQLFVMRFGGRGWLLVNPELRVPRGASGASGDESCLSLPSHVKVAVRRWRQVNMVASGSMFHLYERDAIVAQHEGDHLHGVLIVDRARCPQCRRSVATVASDLTSSCPEGHAWKYDAAPQ